MKLLARIRDIAFIAVLSLSLIVMVPMAGCSITQVESDVQRVITDMPTVLSIAESILTIVAASKGMNPAQLAALQAEATQYEGSTVTNLNTIETVLQAYKTGLGNVSPTVLNELDAAVGAVSQNLTQLETAFHVADPTSQAAVATVTAAVGAFLLGVESLIPAQVVNAMPLTSATLHTAGVKPGSGSYVIPSQRKLAVDFNEKIGPLVPKAKVHVPWVHAGPMPIWP